MNKVLLITFLVFINSIAFSQAYFQHYKKGEDAFNTEDYTSAIDEFSKVIELKPDHDRALNYRGITYEKKESYDKAILDLKEATKLKEKEAEYHANLGRVYYKAKKYTEALASLIIAIDRDKKLMDAYNYKVYSHIALNQYPGAVETAETAVLKEKSGKSYYNLGVAQDSLMKYKEAAYSFSRAVFYEPKMTEAYIGMAFSNMKLNDYVKIIGSKL